MVEVGETLYSISGKYYVSVSDIKHFNNLKSNVISVGQKLKLIGKKSIVVSKNIEHIVVKGDTLFSLSKKYNITVEKLKTLNNLINNNLSLGQKLIIE
ncbi:MAG TPA: LysM peptidoglycan-binding domain-containing protein [Flavobacteriaceae bacterium]|nr:LysM peptidoglycan-binding domain-containing protein [Flavobacteriaceae bacterium]